MKTADTLLEDYKLKAQYLTNHFSRMWTRFNFFLTIHSALFALSVHQDYLDYVPLIAITGVMLSIAWYFFGSTDNYLVEVYRGQVGHTYHLLNKTNNTSLKRFASEDELEDYSYVGDIKESYFDPNTNTRVHIPQDWRQRRSGALSVTELAVVLPSIFFVIWIIRIGMSDFVLTVLNSAAGLLMQ